MEKTDYKRMGQNRAANLALNYFEFFKPRQSIRTRDDGEADYETALPVGRSP